MCSITLLQEAITAPDLTKMPLGATQRGATIPTPLQQEAARHHQEATALSAARPGVPAPEALAEAGLPAVAVVVHAEAAEAAAAEVNRYQSHVYFSKRTWDFFNSKILIMKKYLFLAYTIIATAAMQAQDLNSSADAVRLSTDNINGTARFRAMSGAFGAVGGDLSAINVNPAGGAVFIYNAGTASLTSYNISNNTRYFGTNSKQKDNAVELNQLGAIFVFNNSNEEATWRKLTIGFNYENTNNLDNSIFSRGINPQQSIADYFVPYAQGTTLNTLENAYFEDLDFAGQQAYLGYNAYIFDPLDNTNSNNSTYTANANIRTSNGFYQENSMATTGFNGKVAINFATQFKNWLYLGANLNVHFTDYIKTTSFYEEYNAASTGLQSVRFNNERYTYGGGFSLNLGAIAKVTEAFRVGVAYESPTWYSLQDELTQSISSYCADCDGSGTNIFVTDPGVTMILDDYSVRTPAKWTGSLAYVFGTRGLISVDASIKDYSTTEFTSDGYGDINNDLDTNLGLSREVRVGAEYRIKSFSLRGGFRYEESPYKNTDAVSDLRSFSGGFGYAFGNSRLDLAYSYFRRDMDNTLFNGPDQNPVARVKSDNNNVTLSYTIDL
jgi:hypothetical protein